MSGPGVLARAWLETQRRGLLQLGGLARLTGRTRVQPKHLETGLRGEFEALFFLRRQGYLIIERRWRAPELHGDLDLIAWDGDVLCFVEVKARTARDNTPARSAVDPAKQRILRRMAAAYRRTLPREERDDESRIERFDVVSVYLVGDRVECELLRSAFPIREDESRRGGV